MIGACTIVSPNYLAFARTVSNSYLEQHPAHRFFVLLVADLALAERMKFEGLGFTVVLLEEIGLRDVKREAMKYDILELNTNVKPTLMKYLIDTYDLEMLVYLDPDIFVYSPLTPVFEALEGASVALTPHITNPIEDDKRPSEQDMLYNGTYNLGFIAVRRGEKTARILDWWERRCLDLGFSEGRTGLFVDQKWMNLVPGLFAGVTILRDAGCNMAYWNLHERSLQKGSNEYLVNGKITLRFFHFSGIAVDDPTVLSKNTNRFTLSGRPDLAEIVVSYKAAVVKNRDSGLDAIPYGFDRFTDGTSVTRLSRRIYSQHQAKWAGQNPFDESGEFAGFAKRLGLVAGIAGPVKATWKEFNEQDWRVKMVHRILRLTLKMLGPNKYELLMRYLAHIAVLRNQSVFLDDKPAQ